ncbi:dehydrogenase, FMN-dependent, partial [Oesophagostomum dentatum]
MPLPSEGQSAFMQYVANQIDATLDWKMVEWVISNTKLPVILKGVMRADDAEEAVKKGVQGIIVSNHGGRQLDSAPATIEVLPSIVRAVGGKVPVGLPFGTEKSLTNYFYVFVDGGIRNGRDAFKAIALGAAGVFVGRPVLWGLTVAGAEGVSSVMKLLQSEFLQTMQLAGCRNIREMREFPNLVVK